MDSDLISKAAFCEEIDRLMKSPYAKHIQLGAERREVLALAKAICKTIPADSEWEKLKDRDTAKEPIKFGKLYICPTCKGGRIGRKKYYFCGRDYFCNKCGQRLERY